jgi:acetyl-CoA carboxylase carboxyl transferase subunit beta
MGWFTRTKEGITTATEEKKELRRASGTNARVQGGGDHRRPREQPLGLRQVRLSREDRQREYFAILFDNHKYKEIAPELIAGDPLKFEDTKKYSDRLKKTRADSGLNDALRAAYGKLDKQEVTIACMDFRFIGGSMGSVLAKRSPARPTTA